MGEWYYIGHYGQLGPLTREQIDELIDQEVVVRDTYVWRAGMSEWIYASRVTELNLSFRSKVPTIEPPPPPATQAPVAAPPMPPNATPMPMNARISTAQGVIQPSAYAGYPPNVYFLKSGKSRIAGGVIQFLLPGIGRMYLGYWGIGFMQIILTPCFGIGYLWTFIDGIIILSGGVKVDGYGRVMD